MTAACAGLREAPAPAPELVGSSAAMRALREEIARALEVPFPVLVEGETGTGKDLVAAILHQRGPRRRGPYVALNCAAVSSGLAESQLFGHRRGSFTGAVADQAGLLGAARSGTLFLDEVGQLEPPTQAKLLRAIETGEFTPVGGVRAERTDARIVAATNVDLESGGFRQDLFFRLGVLRIRLPPLRERREDIPHLALHAVERVGARLDVRRPEITPAALELLAAAAWPGNVRQLIHEIERAFTRCDASPIGVEHLSPELRGLEAEGRPSFLEARRRVVEAWERDEIVRGLEQAGWNVARLALELGVSQRFLFERIKAYGLKRPARS